MVAASWDFVKSVFETHFEFFGFFKVAMVFAAAVVAFAIEALVVGWKQSSLSRLLGPGRSQSRDLWIFMLDATSIWFLIGRILTFSIFIGAGAWLGSFLSQYLPYRPLADWSWPLLRAIVIVLFADFISYWIHRAFHSVGFLWELHKFHHSATDLCILTARRDHPFIAQIHALFISVPPALLGVPMVEVWWIAALVNLHAMLVHSSIEGNWGMCGRWIFISPQAHRLHHSARPEHFNRNFGGLTPLWDIVFGTRLWTQEPTRFPVGIAAEADEADRSLVRELAGITARSARALRRKA